MVKRTLDGIYRHGWMVIAAGGNGYRCTYTVGMTRHRLPELIMEGAPPQIAYPLITTLAKRQKAAGAFESGQITQVRDRWLRLDPRPDLDVLEFVCVIYGDHDPVAPTALTVTDWPPPGGGR